ncbi:MAG TPA: hypothetical protein VK972_09390 [Wenzhouxiangella sp.]|nr:hypothetical protein [Wenzhouxiangella sp.]
MNQPIQITTDEKGLASEADVSGADAALNTAQQISVTNAEEAQEAAKFLKQCGAAKKALEERRKAITAPLDQAKRSVMDLFRGPANTLEDARDVVKRKINSWTAEEERKAAEERRKAEEKARKERERAEAKAREYEEQGRADMAEKWETKAEEADMAAPPPSTGGPKVEGVQMRTYYEVEVRDVKELCRAIADGKLPTSMVKPVQGELNKFARTWKGEQEMPGCQVRKTKKAAG